MNNDNRSIPFRITQLIVGFFQRTITEEEHKELDKWITASEENQSAFEDCVEMAKRPYQAQPDDLPNEEDEIYLPHIADLIFKHLRKKITKEETEELNDWLELSEHNKELFNALPQTDNMEILFAWILKWLWQDRNRPEWN